MTEVSRGPDHFVGPITRYEIGIDAIALMALIIDHYGTLLNRQCGQPLSSRVVELQQRLLDCVAGSRNASCVPAGDRPLTRVNASESTESALAHAQSQVQLVDTATAAGTLGIQEDSVRDLCRRGRLQHRKTHGRYEIDVISITNYQTQRGS